MGNNDGPFAVIDCENDQTFGPFDSEAEATAEIILMANEHGWREVIAAGDHPFEGTGLSLCPMQPKTGRALVEVYGVAENQTERIARVLAEQPVDHDSAGRERPQMDVDEEAERLTEMERLTIAAAEETVLFAQFQALHNRIEGFTRWLIEEGILASAAISGPGNRADLDDALFECIEAYLDKASADTGMARMIDQIINPDLEEDAGEPTDLEFRGQEMPDDREDFGPEPGDHGFILS